jgi:cytochrome P450
MTTPSSTVSTPTGPPAGCPYLDGYDPLSPEELRDPYPSLRRIRETAPVSYSEPLGMWSIARHADVLEVLRDSESFSSASALPIAPPPSELIGRMPAYPWAHTVLTMDDPEHRPARDVIQAPFTPRSIKHLEAGIRDRVARLLEPLATTGRIEFVKGVAYPLSLSVIGEILGIPEKRFDLLQRAADGAFRLLGGGLTDHDDIVAAATPVADLRDYMYELVRDRRANPGEDYTSAMLRTPLPDGSFESDDNMVIHVWVIIGAGFETTANMLTLGIRSLLEHPDQWQLVKDDPALVDNAIEEMLRYRSLLKRMFRTTTRDVVVGGVRIPAGARVALLTASAHRDQDYYAEDPDRFDITRRREHLAFGKWKHFCVGAPLARLEMKLTVETLIERFPDLRLPDHQDCVWRRDLRMEAISSLHLECAAAAPGARSDAR